MKRLDIFFVLLLCFVPFVIASGLLASHARALTPQLQRSCAASEVPHEPIAEGDFVELERSPCFGECPSYKLRISANGQVSWVGYSFVEAIGERKTTLSAEAARAAIEKFQTDTFWGACDAQGTDDKARILLNVRLGNHEEARKFLPAHRT